MAIELVDISSDMGEGFGQWRSGEAEGGVTLDVANSVSIPSGFRARNPNAMELTVHVAADSGIGTGAHPWYSDLPGFDRPGMNGRIGQNINELICRARVLRGFARLHRARAQHDATYVDFAGSEATSRSLVHFLRKPAPESIVFTAFQLPVELPRNARRANCTPPPIRPIGVDLLCPTSRTA